MCEAIDIDHEAEEAYKKALQEISEMEGMLNVFADDDKFQYCLSKEIKGSSHSVAHASYPVSTQSFSPTDGLIPRVYSII